MTYNDFLAELEDLKAQGVPGLQPPSHTSYIIWRNTKALESISDSLNALVSGGSERVTAWGLLSELTEELRGLGTTIDRVAG